MMLIAARIDAMSVAIMLLAIYIISSLKCNSQDVPGSVLSKALQILETDIMCLEDVASGSTALVGCITGECVWMANVGDCRAVCEAQGGSVQRLTRDHTASDPDEAVRVASFGGWVEGGRVNGKIEVSRTLGDKALKPPLSSDPEIFCHSVRGLRYFVAASDGLWEVMTDEDAMGLVRDTVSVSLHCIVFI